MLYYISQLSFGTTIEISQQCNRLLGVAIMKTIDIFKNVNNTNQGWHNGYDIHDKNQ